MTTISYRVRGTICTVFAVLLLSLAIGVVSHAGRPDENRRGGRHVILISLDGFHDFDLTRYVAAHPRSAMARLVNSGVTYANAFTTGPSDSYPGSLALTTGGTPVSTGILYDNSWRHAIGTWVQLRYRGHPGALRRDRKYR